MALKTPILSGGKKKNRSPSAVIGLDLGESAMKAVLIRKEGKNFTLSGVSVRPLPADQEGIGPDDIRGLFEPFRSRGTGVRCTISQGKLMIRYVDLPPIEAEQVPAAVRLNRRRYVPSQYEGYRIDAVKLGEQTDEEGQRTGLRVMVAGVDPEQADSVHAAISGAGYRPLALELTPLSVLNAFELAHGDAFGEEAFALADFGMGRTFVSLVHSGELQLTRKIDFGGETLTRELASRLGFDRDAAEELKLTTEAELDMILEPAVQGLCRELRSSFQFVELHGGAHVSRLYVTGGTAASEAFLKVLNRHLGLHVESWDPLKRLNVQVQREEVERLRLSAAIGAALGGFQECP